MKMVGFNYRPFEILLFGLSETLRSVLEALNTCFLFREDTKHGGGVSLKWQMYKRIVLHP